MLDDSSHQSHIEYTGPGNNPYSSRLQERGATEACHIAETNTYASYLDNIRMSHASHDGNFLSNFVPSRVESLQINHFDRNLHVGAIFQSGLVNSCEAALADFTMYYISRGRGGIFHACQRCGNLVLKKGCEKKSAVTRMGYGDEH